MQHKAEKKQTKEKLKYSSLSCHFGKMLWLIELNLVDTQANSLERELDPGACLWPESAVVQPTLSYPNSIIGYN